MIDGHGDDLYLYGEKVKHNFSSNILQNPDHTSLMKWLATRPGLLSNYPEPEPVSVERKIERLNNLPEGSVMVTAGATDAIYIIAQRYAGGCSYLRKPTFSEYEDACRMFGHTFDNHLRAGLQWICNPNNPDGIAWRGRSEMGKEAMTCYVKSRRETLFVFDQAYSDYCVEPVYTMQEGVELGNVLLLSSLTKRFSVPGLRVGYVTGSPELISGLKKLRKPWSVGSVALAASHYLLDHSDEYVIDAHGLNFEARRMAGELQNMGVKVSDTDCNFFLASLPAGSSCSLKAWLIENFGILIRDASNLTGSESDIRIAAQTPVENDLLLKAISEWISLQQ